MDWEGLKKTAFGPLNLHPVDFWSLTPDEYADLVKGYVWRREQDERHRIEQAWLTEYLHRVKKLPSLDKLLGNKKAEPKRLSQEEKKRELDKLKQKFR